MSTLKTKRENVTNGAVADEAAQVLTLAEAASFLRVSEESVLRMVHTQSLAGREIGGQWRFLKSALEDWLGTPTPMTGKNALLALAGVWKDDPDIDQIVSEAE